MKKTTQIGLVSIAGGLLSAAVMMWVWNHVLVLYFTLPTIGYGHWILIDIFLGAVLHSPLQSAYLKAILDKLRDEDD